MVATSEKAMLSIRNIPNLILQDVDQKTGEDLNPKQTRSIVGGDRDKADEARNPDRPTSIPLVSVPEQNDVAERRHAQRPSSPELWELKQMAAASVIDISEMPGFDEETGLLPNDDDSGIVDNFKDARPTTTIRKLQTSEKLLVVILKIELPHDKTSKMACAPSDDSDQPRHPPSLIRVFAVCMKKVWVLSSIARKQRL